MTTIKQYLAVPSADGMMLEEVNPYLTESGEVELFDLHKYRVFKQSKQSFLTDDPTVIAGEKYEAEEFEPIDQYFNVSGVWCDYSPTITNLSKWEWQTRQILRRKAEDEKNSLK